MANKQITKKPSVKVASLGAPTRKGGGSHVMEASWKVPSALVSGSRADRATGLKITWSLGVSGKDPKDTDKTGNEKKAADSENLNSMTTGKKKWTRESFYPHTKVRLSYVTVKVRGYNKKGDGPAASATRDFKAPVEPSLDGMGQDAETGWTGCTVATDAGEGYRERLDTRYKVTVYRSATGKTATVADTSSKSTSFRAGADVPDRFALGVNDFARVRVEAWARGYAGDSGHAVATHVVGYPAKPVITGEPSASSMLAGGKVSVPVRTDASADHPVDRVKLEALVDTDIESAQVASASGGWEETGAVDNGSCTALVCDVSQVIPTAGKHTWVRVKAWHDVEGVFYRHSDPVMLSGIETIVPSAADDAVDIISLVPGDDGASAVAVLGWDKDGSDDSTGTELSWSPEADAWESTRGPETYQFTRRDATPQAEGYGATATVVIKDLEEGVAYHVRARRYMETDTLTSYGDYCDAATVMPAASPGSVALSAPAWVARGSGAALSWAFGSAASQTAWRLMSADLDGTVAASGDDPLGSCTLPWARLSELSEMAGGGAVRLYVAVSTGGEFVESEPRTVRIADPPQLSLGVPETLAAQPLALALSCDAPCDVAYTVTAQGVDGSGPGGDVWQAAGDTVWSEAVSPEWSGGAASVELPAGLDFVDGARYTVTAAATDRATGLASGQAEASFRVAWAHRAPAPPDSISVEARDEVDGDGTRALSATLRLSAPEGALDSDVYDVYRLSADGPVLAGEGYPLDGEARDPYAPFGPGEHAYRVALRTADGDVEWADFPYELPCDSLRVDYGGSYVELPYNVSMSDAYGKDFEASARMGQDRPQGRWGECVSRKGSLSTDLLRVGDPATARAVRELARHAGPALVRGPDGSCYQANVDVTGVDARASGALVAVTLDAEEVALTSEFAMEPPPAGEGDGR